MIPFSVALYIPDARGASASFMVLDAEFDADLDTELETALGTELETALEAERDVDLDADLGTEHDAEHDDVVADVDAVTKSTCVADSSDVVIVIVCVIDFVTAEGDRERVAVGSDDDDAIGRSPASSA